MGGRVILKAEGSRGYYNWTPSQVFKSCCIIINGIFSIYILQLLVIVYENTVVLALYFFFIFAIMGITLIDEQAGVRVFKVSLV